MKNPIIMDVPATATDEELHQMALVIVADMNRQRDEREYADWVNDSGELDVSQLLADKGCHVCRPHRGSHR